MGSETQAIEARNAVLISVIADVARIADSAWLPLLQAWSAVETRRAKEKLAPIVARLEANRG